MSHRHGFRHAKPGVFFQNAREGKYHLHEMADRVSDRRMPTIEVVDMKQVRRLRKETASNTCRFG